MILELRLGPAKAVTGLGWARDFRAGLPGLQDFHY